MPCRLCLEEAWRAAAYTGTLADTLAACAPVRRGPVPTVDRWHERWLRERQRAHRKDMSRKHRRDAIGGRDLLRFRQWLRDNSVTADVDLYGAATTDMRRKLTSRLDRACDIHRQHRSAHPIAGPKGKLP